MNILRCFSLLSGMSINIQKSHLLGVGIPDNCVAEAAKSIGIFLMAFKRVIERLLGSNGLRCLLLRNSEGWEFLVSSLSIGSSLQVGYKLLERSWIGDNLLKLSFPRLFALEENKDISVANKMNTSITSSFVCHVEIVESQQLDQLSRSKIGSLGIQSLSDNRFKDERGVGRRVLRFLWSLWNFILDFEVRKRRSTPLLSFRCYQIFGVYVDDIVLTASSETLDSSWMFLSQKKYAVEILERVYLTFTRPDISYAVQQVCLYMHDPREPHFSVLKRIMRYVRGTLDYGLQLFLSSTTDLVAFLDADWAGCPTTRRSTSGYCVILGNNLLSWSSKRQPALFRFSAEAEYRGVANAVYLNEYIKYIKG
ncbi:ribonuclease H-like domain-containing protein [Tanacetum coccineum]